MVEGCQVQLSPHEHSMNPANPVAEVGRSGQSTPGRPLTGRRPFGVRRKLHGKRV